MKKVVAVAVRQKSPFGLALQSLHASAGRLVDFMYGTPGRSRVTLIFALALLAYGLALQGGDAGALAVCAV